MSFRIRDAHTSAMVAQVSASDAPKAWRAGGGETGFECAGSRCVLRSIWQAGDAYVYNVGGPKFGRGEEVHTAVIAITWSRRTERTTG